MNATTLSESLGILSRILPSRPSKPILTHVLVEPTTDALRLTAFDESRAYMTTISGSHNLTEAVCVPGKLWESIASKLEGELALGHDDDGTLSMAALSGTYEIRTLPANDFPLLPDTEDADTFSIESDVFVQLLGQVLMACSSDESKQILTGAHLTLSEGALEVAATDGRRLALAVGQTELGSAVGYADVTIPANALRDLEKIISKAQESEINITLNRVQASFAIGTDVFLTRLLEGQFPNYRQLIPKQFKREFKCDRKGLIEALERIAVLADQKNNIVKLSFDADVLIVSVDAAEVGKAQEKLPASGITEPFETAFNVRYLLDGLKGIKGDSVTINANTATSPCVLNGGDSGLTYLVMPVQIRS